MEESNNTIFTHAKLEYTAQLVDVITPNLFDGIKSIYVVELVCIIVERSSNVKQ